MSDQNKVLYKHLKDYPTSGKGYREIGNQAVPAAWAHKPEIAEASPEKHPPKMAVKEWGFIDVGEEGERGDA